MQVSDGYIKHIAYLCKCFQLLVTHYYFQAFQHRFSHSTLCSSAFKNYNSLLSLIHLVFTVFTWGETCTLIFLFMGWLYSKLTPMWPYTAAGMILSGLIMSHLTGGVERLIGKVSCYTWWLAIKKASSSCRVVIQIFGCTSVFSFWLQGSRNQYLMREDDEVGRAQISHYECSMQK